MTASTASARFSRIVSLVAELTARERDGQDPPTIGELARQHGVSERDINADIRTLTMLGNHVDSNWLLSLQISQQEDHLSISSAGPFRRPVRLSPEEQLAIQLALALEPDGAALAKRFAAIWSGGASTEPSRADHGAPSIVDEVRRGVRERRVLEIEYAGEGERDVRSRTVQPYQLAESGIRIYLVAWAADVEAWRHFRLDRIISAMLTDRRFEPRPDFAPLVEPRDAFRPAGATERVTVRFRPEAARWVTEFYAEHRLHEDGSVTVEFEATSADWLVRRVLEFGSDAEVVAPAKYRDAVVRAVA